MLHGTNSGILCFGNIVMLIPLFAPKIDPTMVTKHNTPHKNHQHLKHRNKNPLFILPMETQCPTGTASLSIPGNVSVPTVSRAITNTGALNVVTGTQCTSSVLMPTPPAHPAPLPSVSHLITSNKLKHPDIFLPISDITPIKPHRLSYHLHRIKYDSSTTDELVTGFSGVFYLHHEGPPVDILPDDKVTISHHHEVISKSLFDDVALSRVGALMMQSLLQFSKFHQ